VWKGRQVETSCLTERRRKIAADLAAKELEETAKNKEDNILIANKAIVLIGFIL
jgi:hypothetical protein